jgi:hypothetical protein
MRKSSPAIGPEPCWFRASRQMSKEWQIPKVKKCFGYLKFEIDLVFEL